jgi:acid phosphatase
MRLKKPWLFKGLISWGAQNMNADKFNQIPRLLYAMLSIFMAAFIAAPACAQNAFNHIVVVIEENHDYNQVIGNPSMPYFNSIANNYGVATQYYADTHPSIGNYFMLTTGQILTNDDTKTPSNFPVSADNIVRHLIAAGRSWKSYAEDLPSVGHTGDDFNKYVVHHNPFPYFTDVQNDSTQRNNLVPFADPNVGFAHDLANNSLPNYSFVVPNTCNDAHDCALSVADTWLQNNIGPLISNATLMQNTLVIILFDEADTDSTDGGGKIYWVAAGPNVKPSYVSSTLYQHQSTMRETLEGLGLPYNLAAAATAPSMGEFFKPVQCTTTCDTTPPSVPTGLTATSVGGLQVVLSWTPSTDPDSPVAGYKVYRNGNPNPIGTTAVATYTDNTVSPGTTYTYTAAAYDTANNLSAQSLPFTVTTPCPSCGPSVPTSLTAKSVSSSQVSLSWTDADSTVAGYKVYRNGNPKAIGTAAVANYTDKTVSPGTTYTYTVAAYNAAGVPSAKSSSLKVTTRHRHHH